MATIVGEALLSESVKLLLDLASQEVVKFIRGRKVSDTLLTKLKTSCLTLSKVLNDAEEREITDKIVKEWLDELKDAVYQAEDLLDEIATEALRCQVEAEFVTCTSKVRNFISTSFDQFGRKLESKIQEVVDKLEYLASQINAIGLREGVEGRSSHRVPTTSLVDPETIIYGRDDDEKAIVNLLLSNDVASNNHSTEMKEEDEDENEKYFYLTNKVPHDLLLKLRFLRVLSLSHYCNIELPESIGDFKHLRYLDVSFTEIERLPESTCMLVNLQTLNLSGCKFLVKLPKNMRNLINLRHLYISGTSIKNMPIQMGRLQCLQTLTKFVVGKDIGFQIEELGKLSNLRGVIVISNLQNVINSTNALEAKLKDKEHLKELTLEWDAANGIISQSERDVLNNLQPHTSLTKLVIKNYNGTSFPNWIGDSSFSNITVVHLNSCRNCSSLPSLGQLPSLQDLFVFGFDEVVTVDADFYGSGSYTITPFQSLKILRFEAMSKWEKWSPYHGEGEDEGGVFPSLQELYLEKCPKLSGSLPKHLPSLTLLQINECEQLESSLPTAPSIRELLLLNCNDALLKELPPANLAVRGFENLESLPEGVMDHNHCVEELFIDDFPVLKSLPRGGLSSPTTLKRLCIRNCKEVEFPMYPCYSSLEQLDIEDSCNSQKSFPLDIFPKLRFLNIKRCSNMESLSVSEGHHLTDLLRLKICDCPNFVAFPSGGLSAPNLSELEVSNCSRLNSLPENMHTFLPSVQILKIKNCPQIESFPEGGLPSNLFSLRIDDCKKLICNRMEWGLQRLQSLKVLQFRNDDPDCWDVESFPEEYLLPTTVTHLIVYGFGNLRTLDNKGFQHLTSLQYLCIGGCPKFKHMPEEGLPVSKSLSATHQIKPISCPSMVNGEEHFSLDFCEEAAKLRILVNQSPVHARLISPLDDLNFVKTLWLLESNVLIEQCRQP
ncbi:hypothetical protein CMV_025214 [Castanea mollissima]|uniref:Rx N-terminal domain-containing protein n=1 Tax=Castanea mollissima TaxID=60419 RepID=A0A8J4V584_9ROSI|nr:hypothetical protein CMV_025214 [Castanea mollissima]